MRRIFVLPVLVATLALALAGPELARAETAKVNKLLYMYLFYFLPYSVDFRVGNTVNDILPFVPSQSDGVGRMMTNDEFASLEARHTRQRAEWAKSALSLKSKVPMNGTTRIGFRIAAHEIAFGRTSFDSLPLVEQARRKRDRSAAPLGKEEKQLALLRSFLQPGEEKNFNFFLVSSGWDASSRDYRVLFETYFKKFPTPNCHFHSVVIDDPNRRVFDSPAMNELFPTPGRSSHDTIPRFLSVEMVDGKAVILEEGDALLELYERFFKIHRGFSDGGAAARESAASDEGSRLLPSRGK